MKKLLAMLAVPLLGLIVSYSPVPAGANSCVTIQMGLVDGSGNPMALGYDQWGYNYQAHIYNGIYENFTRPLPPYQSSPSNTNLQMKWNDEWLSNTDCDGDGKVDRHYGFPSYRGSGAWLTNHMWGYYEHEGKTYKWTEFVVIVAAPLDATLVGTNWVGSDGIVIGYQIWGDFAVIQDVYNDQHAGFHGVLYKAPANPGMGVYK
jgi:hypothetical protein